MRTFTVQNKTIDACPTQSLLPRHYREDGTCRHHPPEDGRMKSYHSDANGDVTVHDYATNTTSPLATNGDVALAMLDDLTGQAATDDPMVQAFREYVAVWLRPGGWTITENSIRTWMAGWLAVRHG